MSESAAEEAPPEEAATPEDAPDEAQFYLPYFTVEVVDARTLHVSAGWMDDDGEPEFTTHDVQVSPLYAQGAIDAAWSWYLDMWRYALGGGEGEPEGEA